MKKLGFGLMRMPTIDKANAADVDLEQVKQMVDMFMEKGFTYFDTAWMYNGFASESTAKAVLVDRYPRDSFTLATKLHAAFFNSLEDRDKVFNAQLEKTGAGYFDYYLLHGIEADMYPKYEQFDCFNWLLDKKAQGLVKHAGFSFHDIPELLDEILTKHPEMEFVQLQINYLDWESQWIQSRACYEVAVRHDKPVIVMEPVKGGTLANVPEAAEKLFKDHAPEMSVPSWAIRFAASLPTRDINSWSELLDFCSEYGCDYCEDVIDDDYRDDEIDNDIAEAIRNDRWYDIKSYLEDIPTGYSYYCRNGMFDYDGLDDYDFERYKNDVLQWANDEEVWDDEPEDEDYDVFEAELEADAAASAATAEEEPGPEAEDFSVGDLMGMCCVAFVTIKEADAQRTQEEEQNLQQLYPKVLK